MTSPTHTHPANKARTEYAYYQRSFNPKNPRHAAALPATRVSCACDPTTTATPSRPDDTRPATSNGTGRRLWGSLQLPITAQPGRLAS